MKALIAFLTTLGIAMATALPTYETKTLANGMQLYVIPMDNGSGVISTDIFYKVGSRNEVMGKTGIAHMLEHMNFKSTKNLAAGQFDEEVKSIGGVSNASTGFDFTHYFIKSSKDNLDKSLSLFAELMQNLNLKDDEFQPERNVVAEERRWRTDNNPIGYLYFRLFNSAYTYHPYHWTPIGFMNDIQTWSLGDIKSFHETYYQPQNAMLVVTGDIDPKTVFERAQDHFGTIAKGPEVPEVRFVEPRQDGPKRSVLFKESEVEMVAIVYHIPDFTHPDQPALSAISELLTSGKSSRLYEELVDKQQMVNQVYAYNMETIDPGVFIFLAVCNPGVKAEEAEKALLEQMERLKNEPVSTEELEKVKINTRADFIYSLESSSSVADLFGSYLARGDLKPLETYEANINALTPADIQKAARTYFDHNLSTTIILRKGEL